ncbi:Cyclin-dependent kinase inhibitor [Melia azedarach]|uniref:Cyclin-dependent kinase inhibitor n=1 Tax=Melia azedarach TaxID=155640 RepID=A0ACC1XYW0_MELAZ|nr:Cyclin-dependent kinase inhibitor [Melia azedarach]
MTGEGDCTNTSKRIAGNVVEIQEDSNPSLSLLSKRTKITSQELKELKLPSTTTLLENDHFLVVSPEKTSTSSDFFSVSDEFSSSRCSSNDLHEIVNNIFKSADLEATSFETEVSTCNNKFRETSPLSDICREETSMDSPSKLPPENQRRKPTVEVEKMPSMAEIDEFFSVAEKHEQKRFAEKYNYDIVKDVPLEGRYQWVRLKP